ncbi:Cupredoxin superfamily protein [Striga hermonthica]|uniref:Cupredoxin superfamily protein n=1 Tax=Striga hermonthica TaxID=68872 RepID=A0A9N7NHI7_STRHE|nr:Cupredoxin superfamily protein [Striga hermonthica]
MGLNLNFAVVVFVGTSVVSIAMGTNIWPWGGIGTGSWCPCAATGKDADPSARTIVVGGTDNWNYGVNYTDWLIKNGPFYIGDTLVFSYTTHHSVYLMKDWGSFINCSMEGSILIGSTTAGAGAGFKVTLEPAPFWQPYLFVCGEKNGIHCSAGQMKFPVWPLPRFRKQ